MLKHNHLSCTSAFGLRELSIGSSAGLLAYLLKQGCSSRLVLADQYLDLHCHTHFSSRPATATLRCSFQPFWTSLLACKQATILLYCYGRFISFTKLFRKIVNRTHHISGPVTKRKLLQVSNKGRAGACGLG